MKREIWIGLVQLKALRKEPSILEGAGAYTNILTWADSLVEYERKVKLLAADYDLYVVEIEDAEPTSIRFANSVPDPVIEDLIGQAEGNQAAILFSTFHTYPHEES